MHARKMVRKGFTLVEILIVVVILGILAAIVIPQFTNASTAAKASSVTSQLQTIRSQVELYKNQHNGVAPDLVTDWTQFTGYTDIDGDVEAAKSQATGHIYGPYMQQPAKNPFNGSSTVGGTFGTDATAGSDTVGWLWDGEVIKASVPTAIAADQNMDTTNDVLTY